MPGCATCGPTFVVDAKGRRRGVDWTFNAWGGLDGGPVFPVGIAMMRWRGKYWRSKGAERYRTEFVLEGGAIHVDGQGTCLTTEECLLNPNRNANLSRADIEEHLRRYLGVTTVIWLGKGVYLMRPAVISMNSPALPARGTWRSPGPRTALTPSTRFHTTPISACVRRATRVAGS